MVGCFLSRTALESKIGRMVSVEKKEGEMESGT